MEHTTSLEWERLKSGDTINIIAPSSGKVDSNTIEEIKHKFKGLGYKLKIPNDLLRETFFCSNTDEYRLNNLIESLNDPSASAIWVLRGGYGCARIISKFKNLTIPAKEKIFIGYSDITALHLYFSQKWGWKTIHSPIAEEITSKDKDPNNFKILFELLKLKDYQVNIPIEAQLNNVRFTSISGKLSGGNLSLVQTSIGTDWQLDSKNKIIFLEDLDEAGYRIDRMLEHLSQAEVLKRAKAIVFGEFSEKEGQSTNIMDALIRLANNVNIPVFKTKYFGHKYHNYPLVYNAVAEISNTKDRLLLKYSMGNQL